LLILGSPHEDWIDVGGTLAGDPFLFTSPS
jgi:hypothetical protein